MSDKTENIQYARLIIKLNENIPNVYFIVTCGDKSYSSNYINDWSDPVEFPYKDEELKVEIKKGIFSKKIGTFYIKNYETGINFDYAQPHWYPINNNLEAQIKIGIVCQKEKSPYKEFDGNEKNPDEIYQEATKYNNESQKITKRILGMTKNMENISDSATESLLLQGEQLERIDNKIRDIDHTTRQSERKMRSIESFWGTVANKITKDPTKSNKKSGKNENRKTENCNRKTDKDEIYKNSIYFKDDAKINFPSKEYKDTQNEIDNDLEIISFSLEKLKEKSLNINNILKDGNLNKIKVDLDKVTPKIDSVTQRANIICKK